MNLLFPLQSSVLQKEAWKVSKLEFLMTHKLIERVVSFLAMQDKMLSQCVTLI